jgi:hypothetical protein
MSMPVAVGCSLMSAGAAAVVGCAVPLTTADQPDFSSLPPLDRTLT